MSTRTMRAFIPVLTVLGAMTAIPASAGFIDSCALGINNGMPDTPLSSPVTFAEFCPSSFSSLPLQQLSLLGAIDTSTITGVEFRFTVSAVIPPEGQSFTPATVDLYFSGGALGGSAPLANLLSGGCGLGQNPPLNPKISGPGTYDTLECAVSQANDMPFLTQLQTGIFFVALKGANGNESADYSAASVQFFTSSSVPEPSTVTSVITGIGILAALRRRAGRR